MKYYVAVNDQAEGPYDEDDVCAMVDAGRLTRETLVQVIGGEKWIGVEGLLRSRAGRYALAAAAAMPKKGVSPPAHLRVIRADSCYGFFRVFLNVVVGLIVVPAMIMEAFYLNALRKGYGDPADTWTMEVLILGPLVSICVTLALRQFVLALLDIADAMVRHDERESRRK